MRLVLLDRDGVLNQGPPDDLTAPDSPGPTSWRRSPGAAVDAVLADRP
ncbi:MAG: hypothetical protein IH999_08800 [Proteobacteria bacterium]|nr:hypothetical protein [Pseudomonadota bacterium]